MNTNKCKSTKRHDFDTFDNSSVFNICLFYVTLHEDDKKETETRSNISR
jgi:hypothetical protein